MLEVNGHRKQGRPEQTWRRQVEENAKRSKLKVEKAANRTKWSKGVRAIAEERGASGHPWSGGKKRIKIG